MLVLTTFVGCALTYDGKLDNLQDNRAQEILAKLKTVPVSEYEKQLEFYQELVDLNPEDSSYKEKVKFYQEQISENILAKLKTIPVSEYEKKLKLYQELVDLNPEDSSYRAYA
jgi:tetratricopeptide (TPR) repeat protein